MRKARPAEHLLPLTEKWFDGFPPDRAPCALASQYPRVCNMIAVLWNDHRGAPELFEDLLTDRRGGRAGFPPAGASSRPARRAGVLVQRRAEALTSGRRTVAPPVVFGRLLALPTPQARGGGRIAPACSPALRRPRAARRHPDSAACAAGFLDQQQAGTSRPTGACAARGRRRSGLRRRAQASARPRHGPSPRRRLDQRAAQLEARVDVQRGAARSLNDQRAIEPRARMTCIGAPFSVRSPPWAAAKNSSSSGGS